MRLPLFTSLRGYDPGRLRGDVIAGLTVWAVPAVYASVGRKAMSSAFRSSPQSGPRSWPRVA